MNKLILTLAVTAFVFSPTLLSRAAGHGAEQLLAHHNSTAGGVTKSAKHHSKKHKKHVKKHPKHHKKHKKS